MISECDEGVRARTAYGHTAHSPHCRWFCPFGADALIVSFVATLRAVGFAYGLFALWMSAWIPSWLVAFPTVLVVAPAVRRFVERNTKKPDWTRSVAQLRVNLIKVNFTDGHLVARVMKIVLEEIEIPFVHLVNQMH